MAHDLAPLAGLRRARPFRRGLLVGLWSVWVSRTSGQTVPTIHLLAEIGEGFFNAIVFTQLSLVLLAAPAATAGTICQDRSSGRLAQLMATDLSDAEIVLGKLGRSWCPLSDWSPVRCRHGDLRSRGRRRSAALAGAFLITVCVGIFGSHRLWPSRSGPPSRTRPSWRLMRSSWSGWGRSHLGWARCLWGFPTSPDWLIWSRPFYLAVGPTCSRARSAYSIISYLGGHAHQLVGDFGAGHRQDAGRGRRRRRPLRLPAGRAASWACRSSARELAAGAIGCSIRAPCSGMKPSASSRRPGSGPCSDCIICSRFSSLCWPCWTVCGSAR